MQLRCLKLWLLPLLGVVAASLPACITIDSPVVQTYTDTEYRTETAAQAYTENITKVIDARSGSYDLTPLFSWFNTYVYFNGVGNTWYYAYEIPREPAYDNIRLHLRVYDQLQYEKATIRILDMSQAGHIYTPDPKPEKQEKPSPEERARWPWIYGTFSPVWLTEANNKINQSRFLAGRTNLWSGEENRVLEADAGRASSIGVIISGPIHPWNARISLSVDWSLTITETHQVTREKQVTRQVPYTVQKQRTVVQTRQVPFWEALFR